MVTCNRRQVVGGLGSIGLGATLFGCSGMARAADKIAIDEASVLIVVDVQNCFLPGGSLAVNGCCLTAVKISSRGRCASRSRRVC